MIFADKLIALRKKAGWSQEELAELVGVSRSLISAIEAPRLAYNFTLDVFFNIADALGIPPGLLIQEASKNTFCQDVEKNNL